MEPRRSVVIKTGCHPTWTEKNLEKEGSTTHGPAGDKELFGIHVSAALGKHFLLCLRETKLRYDSSVTPTRNHIHEVRRSLNANGYHWSPRARKIQNPRVENQGLDDVHSGNICRQSNKV